MVKPNLRIEIGKLQLKNPVMVASGTFGSGEEFKDLVNLNKLGAIITKSVTLSSREGNPSPRIVETPSGIINSIGLQNDGIQRFLEDKALFLRKLKCAVIVSIAGYSSDEYAELVERLDSAESVDAIEMNISCPNVKGGLEFSKEDSSTFEVVSFSRKKTSKTLIVKLSPNVKDIGSIAKAAEEAGADAVSLVNTFTAMAIDIETRSPLLGNVAGGLSGPAIKPIAIRMVWEVFKKVRIPVIGIGGIMDYKDAVEFMIAGASAFQVGTANFVDPAATMKVLDGIETYMREKKVKNLKELIGCLEI